MSVSRLHNNKTGRPDGTFRVEILVVERRRIELPTSALRTQRSPS